VVGYGGSKDTQTLTVSAPGRIDYRTWVVIIAAILALLGGLLVLH